MSNDICRRGGMSLITKNVLERKCPFRWFKNLKLILLFILQCEMLKKELIQMCN